MNDRKRIRVYLAGPLFTQAEWQWNERLAERFRERGLDVILPQRGAEPMLSGEVEFNAEALFKMNVEHIESADVVVAIFDGADIDSGTAWECGYAFKLEKPVVGIRTDIRAGGDDPKAGTNLMLSASCSCVVPVPLANRTDLSTVAERVVEAVTRAANHSVLGPR